MDHLRCRAVEPPLFVLGVRRSGTTLLRVMLDRHPALAVPDESYFIPALAARHRGVLDVADFCDDLARIPAIRDWEVDADAVRGRLAPGARAGDGIAAVYEAYAALRGKERWGDKTPMYMGWLSLINRLFPAARYVHLIRDGRDAALSFLAMPQELVTTTWMHPRDAAGFEAVAGDTLAACGYLLAERRRAAGPDPAARARLAGYRARAVAWRA